MKYFCLYSTFRNSRVWIPSTALRWCSVQQASRDYWRVNSILRETPKNVLQTKVLMELLKRSSNKSLKDHCSCSYLWKIIIRIFWRNLLQNFLYNFWRKSLFRIFKRTTRNIFFLRKLWKNTRRTGEPCAGIYGRISWKNDEELSNFCRNYCDSLWRNLLSIF